MKTIATAVVLMMLAVPTWADEPQNEQANDPSNSNEPIVLREAEMDNITAGTDQVPSTDWPLPGGSMHCNNIGVCTAHRFTTSEGHKEWVDVVYP